MVKHTADTPDHNGPHSGINDPHHHGQTYGHDDHHTLADSQHSFLQHTTHWQPDVPDLGATLGHDHFDPHTADVHEVAGDPGHFMPAWHQQRAGDTCAVASQEFILSNFGITASEETLANFATSCGCYNHGTPPDHLGSLLEAFGLEVHREFTTLPQLVEHMQRGDKVIAAVDAHRIWHDRDTLDGSALTGGGANHAVQVIGITDYGTDHAQVILNDPGTPEGCGMLVPLKDFESAWMAGDNYLAYVPAYAIPTLQHSVQKLFPALATYTALTMTMAADPTFPGGRYARNY